MGAFWLQLSTELLAIFGESLIYSIGFMALYQVISDNWAARSAKRSLEIFNEALYRKQSSGSDESILHFVAQVKEERRKGVKS